MATTIEKCKNAVNSLRDFARHSFSLEESFPEVSWHQELPDLALQDTVSKFKIETLGDIFIPVSGENVEKVKEYCHQTAEYEKEAADPTNNLLKTVHTLEICDASKFSFPSGFKTYLSSLVIENLLKCKLEKCDFELEMEKLVLYQADGFRKQDQQISVTEDSERKIAKVILFVPVEGGHQGGRLNIFSSFRNHNTSIEIDNNGRLCFLSAFNPCNHIEMEPITEGSLLTFEFKLMFSNPLPRDLLYGIYPAYLSTFSQVKESLRAWEKWTQSTFTCNATVRNHEEEIDLDRDNDNEEVMRQSCSNETLNSSPEVEAVDETNITTIPLIHWSNEWNVDENSIDESSNDDAFNASTDSDCEEEEYYDAQDHIKWPDIQFEQSEMFLIPLQSTFQNTSPSFEALSNSDLMISELLQSIPFIDVHLAIVAQRVSEEMTLADLLIDWTDEEDYSDRTFWVKKWIHGRNSIPHQVELKLDMKKQLLGNFETILKKDFYVDKETKELFTEYYHAVFIIQPRHSSIRLGCHCDFQNVVNHMWSLASSMHEKSTYFQEKIRQHLILTVKQVLAYCRKEPYRVFSQLLKYEIAGPVRRLMDLCTVLKAKEEGLELLAILGADFQLNPDNVDDPEWNDGRPFYVGIGDTIVSKAIADFHCQVCGWEDCTELVLNLIQSSRQLPSFTRLILCLIDRDCKEAALQITSRLSSLLLQLDLSKTDNLSLFPTEISDYFDVVLVLEADSTTAVPKRIEEFLSLFGRLDLNNQCRLVIDLHEKYNRIQKVPSCLELYLEFCHTIVSTGLPSSRSINVSIVQLVQCFSKLDSNKLLIMLVDEILGGAPATEKNSEISSPPRDLLREEILLSSWIWQQPLIVSRIMASSPAKIAFYKIFDNRMEIANEQNDSESEVLTCELIDGLRFVMCMESHRELADPWRQASFAALISRLNIKLLSDLISSLTKSDCRQLKKQESAVINFACRQFHSREPKSFDSLTKRQYLRNIKRFMWLEKESDVQSAIEIVCFDGDLNCNSVEQQWLTEMILTSSAVFGDLDSLLNTFISESIHNMVIRLIELWVVKLSEVADPDQNKNSETDVANPNFIEKIIKSFRISIKAEILWPENVQHSNIEELFNSLFNSLPFHPVFELIENIFNLEFEKSPNLKELSVSSKLFRNLCRRCVTSQDYDDYTNSSPSDIKFIETMLRCFFWVDDHVYLFVICSKVCSDSTEETVKEIANSKEFQCLALNSLSGRTAFSFILDEHIASLKKLVYPAYSYCQPGASFPSQPEIESFLRSDENLGEFGNLSDFHKVKSLADLLRENVFKLQVEMLQEKPSKHWTLKLTKTGMRVNFPLFDQQQETMAQELSRLTGLRQEFEKKGFVDCKELHDSFVSDI